jgi:hypothetical protein
MVTRAPVIHLPGEVRFADPTGLVTGAAHCALKDAALTVDNKTMTAIKGFGQFGEWETRTGKKTTLELQLEAPSLEIEALLTAGDIIPGPNYRGWFGEIVSCAGGTCPALTHIPVLEGSEVVRKCSDVNGKTVTHLLQFTTAAPNVDTYSITNGTGVILMDAAYNDYGIVNYAEANAAAGEKLISNDSLAIPHQDVTIIARAWDPELELQGSVVFVFEACEVIQEPGQSLSMEAANVATVRFNVGGNIKKSVYVA